MKLIYPIKIKYRDGVINDLFSPHLRVNFISQYLDLAIKSGNNEIPLNVHLKVEFLQAAVVNYVSLVQRKNYKLRHPESAQVNFIHENDQWVNVQINVQLKQGPFEKTAQIVSIVIFLASFALGEFLFILAARMNKIPYTTILMPIMADFLMSSILYYYSGATSNMVFQGKELDDWFYNRCASSFEETESETNYPLLSTWNLSRALLFTLALSNTVFGGYSYWQSIMAMKKQFEQSNTDDPIITPTFIYDLAIITIIIDAFYQTAKHSSFALKATNTLKLTIDNFYVLCKDCFSNIKIKNYLSVASSEEKESEIIVFGSNPLHATSLIDDDSLLEYSKKEKEDSVIVFFVKDFFYNNPFLNEQNILFEIRNIYGMEILDRVLNIGEEDNEVAVIIIEYINTYGLEHVLSIIFNNNKKNYSTKLQIDENVQATLEPIIVELKQNFFLTVEKGIKFIQFVASNFDSKTLDIILGLGNNHDIAEQIIFEAEVQGTNRVIATLLGKEAAVESSTDNIANIISEDELNQLKLIPNGIFNSWSDRVCKKIVDYIDNFAKNLDDLLNAGKSGTQVAVTLAVLEELLGFAASGQKFIWGRPSHYDTDDDSDLSYGSGGSSNGNHNRSAENFDNQNGFIGLMFPAYNGTDYNITDYQM